MIPQYLIDGLILLSAAVVVVPLSIRFGLGSVLGFLLAGAMIGPWGLGLITEVEEIRHFAELGVVFLLFIIGIELKPSRLWLMRRWVFGMGSAQILATGLILGLVTYWLGITAQTAVIIGLGLALSSTAFVLQILAEQNSLNTSHGRHIFSILLMQDLAVVPLLALIPLLAAGDFTIGTEMALAFAEGVLILILVIIGGRYLLTPLLYTVAIGKNREIFAATAVLIVIGTAVLLASVGFSMAMGAFIAGVLIAESSFRHQVMADIQPFRGFLLGLFFMSVGMSVDIVQFANNPLIFFALLFALLLIKFLILLAVTYFYGIAKRQRIAVSLLLAQSGEFAFVLFGVSNNQGLIDQELFHQLILVVALSMAITPLLAKMSQRFQGKISDPISPEDTPDPGEHGQVVIAGFGRVGRRVAELFRDAGVPYLAIEKDAEQVAWGRERGYSVFYGDASRSDVLLASGLDFSKLMVITLDDLKAVEHLVANLRTSNPALPIYTRGHDTDMCNRLLSLGANVAISESFESSMQLGASALQQLGYDPTTIDIIVRDVRARRGVFQRTDT